MSIASALSAAASGLVAVSRGTDVVAGNVANALTPGYARREMVLSGLSDGGGVRVASITRIVSASLVGDSRIAGAARGYSQTITTFRSSLEATTGVAGDGASLSDRVSDLEAALLSAGARPDNDVRLGSVALAAGNLAGSLNAASDAIADARTEADRGIAAGVHNLRGALADVARLNRSIIVDRANGRDAAALMDERQRIIDGISSIVPVREVPRENGRIALFTAGGATLLDGKDPIDLSFVPAGYITAGMGVGTPPVARLMLNGDEVGDGLMSLFAGGSLAAQFAIRDQLAPQAQAGLDAMARDLIERFSDPALDPSLASGAPGLFTDGGAAPDLAAGRGMAGRMALNGQVTADGAGNWRLRDGLNAPAPGDIGRSTLLTALAARLAEPRASSSAGMSSGLRSAAGFAAEIAASASTNRVLAEAALARDTVHSDALRADILADGVDTDREMQRLLELERAYAANAKVIQAADAMISRMLEM